MRLDDFVNFRKHFVLQVIQKVIDIFIMKVKISVKENKNCDKDFFDNYLLQATVLFDTEKCSDIEADGATEGNLGDDRQLLYNIMEGTEKEIHITA